MLHYEESQKTILVVHIQTSFYRKEGTTYSLACLCLVIIIS